jgi:hypothetical protein
MLSKADATVGADDEVLFDTSAAGGAKMMILQLVEERLCLQGAFVAFGEGLLGAQDEIENQAQDIEEHYEQYRHALRCCVVRARLDVSVSPDPNREPEDGSVSDTDRDDKPHRVLPGTSGPTCEYHSSS